MANGVDPTLVDENIDPLVDQVNPVVEDQEKDVPPRVGTRLNKDGTESTHLMRAEQLPSGNWVSFPSLFQNKDGSWVDMSNEKNWKETYKEARKRGEVINFGENKEKALAFGKGSWKEEQNQSTLFDSILQSPELKTASFDKSLGQENPMLDKLPVSPYAKEGGFGTPGFGFDVMYEMDEEEDL